jgi:hypothetical protein
VDAYVGAAGQDQPEDQGEGQAEPRGQLDRAVNAVIAM